MRRHTDVIRAAAKRHSAFWQEIIELADRCSLSVKETGSYQAMGQSYVLGSGIVITGRDAMKLALALSQALKNVPNVEEKCIWDDLDGIRNNFPAAANA
jgi:hypothetical protein